MAAAEAGARRVDSKTDRRPGLAETGLTAPGRLHARADVHIRGVKWGFSTEAVCKPHRR